MTAPATLDREKLYVTDDELIQKLGVPERMARAILADLTTKHAAFPKKQKLWGDRRYWPAVKAYFDRLNGMLPDDAARLAAEHRATRLPRHSSLRSHPAEGHTHD
jgi:hypothetical protein